MMNEEKKIRDIVEPFCIQWKTEYDDVSYSYAPFENGDESERLMIRMVVKSTFSTDPAIVNLVHRQTDDLSPYIIFSSTPDIPQDLYMSLFELIDQLESERNAPLTHIFCRPDSPELKTLISTHTTYRSSVDIPGVSTPTKEGYVLIRDQEGFDAIVSEQQAVGNALALFQKEDPTLKAHAFRIAAHSNSGVLKLYGYGVERKLHRRIIHGHLAFVDAKNKENMLFIGPSSAKSTLKEYLHSLKRSQAVRNLLNPPKHYYDQALSNHTVLSSHADTLYHMLRTYRTAEEIEVMAANKTLYQSFLLPHLQLTYYQFDSVFALFDELLSQWYFVHGEASLQEQVQRIGMSRLDASLEKIDTQLHPPIHKEKEELY